MAVLVISKLDDDIVEALSRRADRLGCSLEDAARQALAASVSLPRENAVARLDMARKRIRQAAGPSVLDDLRADRNRDGCP